MHKRIATTALILSTLLALPAWADRYEGEAMGSVFRDRARVVDVKPLKEIVRVPVTDRECWTEEVVRPARRDPSGIIAGGIIGGAVGNAMGRGHRDQGIATVAGTVLGGVIGNAMAGSHRPARIEHERRCRVSEKYYEEERISGYLVTYRYRGREFTREMDERPGRYVTVRVAVEPVED